MIFYTMLATATRLAARFPYTIVVFPLFPTYPSLTNIERMAFSADLHGPRIGRVYTYPVSTYHAFSVLCISYNSESSYIAYDTTLQSD